MGRIGGPKWGFLDFLGEINEFQNNEEIVFEFSGGWVIQLRHQEFDNFSDVFDRGDLFRRRESDRERVGRQVAVDCANCRDLVGPLGVDVGDDGGSAHADGGRSAAGEAGIGVA